MFDNQQAKLGIGLMCVGVLLGSPFLICFGALEYLTRSNTLANALAAVAITLFITAPFITFGPLIAYSAIGLYALGSAAKSTYSHNKGFSDLVKDNLYNPDDSTFKKIVRGITGVLLSPFWILGGLLGQGTKALVKAYSSSPSNGTEVAESHDVKDRLTNSIPPVARPSSQKGISKEATTHRSSGISSSPTFFTGSLPKPKTVDEATQVNLCA
ncbi:MAG: hypothetical protein NTW94_07660 [Legionellales bacterium]|nr:hypothetical protein [Legionellales bacterium]